MKMNNELTMRDEIDQEVNEPKAGLIMPGCSTSIERQQ